MFEHNKSNRSAAGSCFFTCLLWLSLLAAAPAHSATVTFTGTIIAILEDTGGGAYAGTAVGSSFSGSFVYGNSPLDATEIYSDPIDAGWLFTGGSYGGVITDGTTPTTGISAEVGVSNDWVLDADEALLFSYVVGSPVLAGTVVDAWSVFSLTSGAYYDDTDTLFNGTEFGIGFYSLDGSLYSSLDYQNLPPELSAVDGGFIYIEQADASGNTQFLALGQLTATTAVVPVPAAVWLFGSGLLGLIGIARRKARAA